MPRSAAAHSHLCCRKRKTGNKTLNHLTPGGGLATEATIRALNASWRQLWPSGSPASPPFSGFSDGGHDDTSCNLSAKTKISPE